MSIEALRWALDVGQEKSLDPTQRHILLILGNRADEAGHLYPSIKWICDRTGLSRRTVQEHCKLMEKAGLFRRSPRANGSGDRTSDNWHLAMNQPGLGLEDPPRAESAPPRADNSVPPARRLHGGGAARAPDTQDQKKEKQKKDAGGAAPSPVAAAFKAYQAGLKKLHGADYPPSAKANGQLAQVVARVGGGNVVAVVEFYLASSNPYYRKRRFPLDVLVKDCEQLYMDIQRASGGAVDLNVKPTVLLVRADEEVARDLGEFPMGAPLDVAKKVFATYRGMIQRMITNRVALRYLDVMMGKARNRYSLAELEADPHPT